MKHTLFYLFLMTSILSVKGQELVKPNINGNIVAADVPENATTEVFNRMDENNFLVLPEEHPLISVSPITLNDSDIEQPFNPATDHSQLIGGTTINGNGTYLQNRTEGGGGGAKFLVNTTPGTYVTCSKITFGIRSQKDDVVAFDVTIAGKTQSFNYTSTRSADDVDFDFDTPVTFTNTSQEIEIITTALTNSDGLNPRFRIYDLTFHLAIDMPNDTCRMLDSLVLVDIYNGTDGANWTKPWNLNEPLENWYGVSLNQSGCVKVLDLDADSDCLTCYNSTNNLVGDLPASIWNLRELKHLNLNNNTNLNGTISSNIHQLQKLQTLAAYNANLSGNLPDEIGGLLDLQYIRLARNNFNGTIPSALGNLTDFSLPNYK